MADPETYSKGDWTNLTPAAIKAKMDNIEDGIKANNDSLLTKVDKVSGKDLSTNDYDNTEKAKLAGIEAEADKTDAANVASSIEGGTATETPNDTDIIPGVKADHSLLHYTWANIKAAIASFLDRASTTVKGIVQFATDGESAASKAVQANDSRLAASGAFVNPAISVGSGSCGTNASLSGGRYTLIGDLVFFRVTVASAATISSPSGSLKIGPLPFAAHADSIPSSVLTAKQGTNALANMTGFQLAALIPAGANEITIQKIKDGAISDAGNIFDTSTGRSVSVSGFYRKA